MVEACILFCTSSRAQSKPSSLDAVAVLAQDVVEYKASESFALFIVHCDAGGADTFQSMKGTDLSCGTTAAKL